MMATQVADVPGVPVVPGSVDDTKPLAMDGGSNNKKRSLDDLEREEGTGAGAFPVFSDFDVTGVKLDEPTKMGEGKCCFVTKGVSKKFEMPKLKAPFGLQRSKTGTSRPNLELSFDTPELVKFAEELWEHGKNLVVEKSKEWFGKKLTRDKLEAMEMFKNPLWYSQKSPDLPPLFRSKVQERGKVPTTVSKRVEVKPGVFVQGPGTPLDLEERQIQVQTVLEICGLYIQPKEVGWIINLSDAVLYPEAKAKKSRVSVPAGSSMATAESAEEYERLIAEALGE